MPALASCAICLPAEQAHRNGEGGKCGHPVSTGSELGNPVGNSKLHIHESLKARGTILRDSIGKVVVVVGGGHPMILYGTGPGKRASPGEEGLGLWERRNVLNLLLFGAYISHA